jgi:hypothetical protein
VFSILDEVTIRTAVAAREDEIRRLLAEGEARQQARSREPRTSRWRVEPGKEEDFRYLRGWLASSEWLDRLIAATEPEAVAGTDSTGSPRLHLAGRTLPAAGRRLLEWTGSAVAAPPGKSQSNRR